MPQSDSYARGPTSVPRLDDTIGDNLRGIADRFPDRDALVVRSQAYRASYRELWNATTAAAKALLAHGVERGDRVGLWSPNRFEWVVVQYATARVGAILVNVNPAFKARELTHVVNQSGMRLLILAAGFRQTRYGPILDEARPTCPFLLESIVIDEAWDEFLASGDAVDDAALAARESTLRCDDAINIQYTSGTTGLPKGATLSHHNVLNNGFFCGEVLRYTEVDRVCIPVPFYHCFGMVIGNLACTTHGSCMVVPGESFDAGETLATTESERCTALYGVPTMYIAQLNHPHFDDSNLSTLRTGVMAGSPCPEAVMREVQERMHMREVTICYGMTETSPVSTQTHVDDPLIKRVTTVGRVHPHTEVKIVDPADGHVVPRGMSGELCTRGYLVMRGYWNDQTATTDAIDEDGWMHSGDLASLDADGYVAIVGRLKDVIIRGGENIYPREIEEFLYTHPDIEDAQVIGVPSEEYGEEVMAWIKSTAALSPSALKAFCHGQIATYKIPRYWKRVDGFPLTVTGKVQKYRMRTIAAAELAARRHDTDSELKPDPSDR